jgi:hypothetical protein
MTPTRREAHPRLVAATRVQLGAWRTALGAGAERIGWKLAYGIPEIEASVGEAPAIGYLTSATLFAPGGRHHAAGARALRAETEVAIVLARHVAPDADARTADAAIGALQVALELVDVGRPPNDLEGIVANNVFHRAASLGPTTEDTGLHDAAARAIVNGELRETAPIRSDHAVSVRAVADMLGRVGERPASDAPARSRSPERLLVPTVPRLTAPRRTARNRRYRSARRRAGSPALLARHRT